jgi:hypothetical protein
VQLDDTLARLRQSDRFLASAHDRDPERKQALGILLGIIDRTGTALARRTTSFASFTSALHVLGAGGEP